MKEPLDDLTNARIKKEAAAFVKHQDESFSGFGGLGPCCKAIGQVAFESGAKQAIREIRDAARGWIFYSTKYWKGPK